MQLLIMLLALAFRHFAGAPNPVQQDQWFARWLKHLDRYDFLNARPWLRLTVALGVPVAGVLLIFALVDAISGWLVLPLGVLVLLYGFGRQRPAARVDAYNSACACDDWALASRQAAMLGVDTTEVPEGDWPLLNRHVLTTAAYRGFEVLFAVLFWFVLLGPLAALTYRLSHLYQRTDPADDTAAHWVWLLEWPAARVFGLSLAVTGNFSSCFRSWQRLLTSESTGTEDFIAHCVRGALSSDSEGEALAEVGRRELSGHLGLFNRTFWLWVGILCAWAILV